MTVEEIHALSRDRPWFLREIRKIIEMETEIGAADDRRVALTLQAQRLLRQAAREAHRPHGNRRARTSATPLGIRPVYKRVDTCAAEFEATTPYLYSTYETENEAEPTDRAAR